MLSLLRCLLAIQLTGCHTEFDVENFSDTLHAINFKLMLVALIVLYQCVLLSKVLTHFKTTEVSENYVKMEVAFAPYVLILSSSNGEYLSSRTCTFYYLQLWFRGDENIVVVFFPPTKALIILAISLTLFKENLSNCA